MGHGFHGGAGGPARGPAEGVARPMKRDPRLQRLSSDHHAALSALVKHLPTRNGGRPSARPGERLGVTGGRSGARWFRRRSDRRRGRRRRGRPRCAGASPSVQRHDSVDDESHGVRPLAGRDAKRGVNPPREVLRQAGMLRPRLSAEGVDEDEQPEAPFTHAAALAHARPHAPQCSRSGTSMPPSAPHPIHAAAQRATTRCFIFCM